MPQHTNCMAYTYGILYRYSRQATINGKEAYKVRSRLLEDASVLTSVSLSSASVSLGGSQWGLKPHFERKSGKISFPENRAFWGPIGTISSAPRMTVGFLYGAGPIFVDKQLRKKKPRIFVSRQKNQSQLWIPRKPRKIGVWVSGAEIQTSAVDTRTAVWVSTAEKFSREKLGIFLESLGGSQRQLCIKARPLSQPQGKSRKCPARTLFWPNWRLSGQAPVC